MAIFYEPSQRSNELFCLKCPGLPESLRCLQFRLVIKSANMQHLLLRVFLFPTIFYFIINLCKQFFLKMLPIIFAFVLLNVLINFPLPFFSPQYFFIWRLPSSVNLYRLPPQPHLFSVHIFSFFFLNGMCLSCTY